MNRFIAALFLALTACAPQSRFVKGDAQLLGFDPVKLEELRVFLDEADAPSRCCARKPRLEAISRQAIGSR